MSELAKQLMAGLRHSQKINRQFTKVMMKKKKPWPVRWPRFHQSNQPCDMLVGPCACGAWHNAGEFELRSGVLYRHGERV